MSVNSFCKMKKQCDTYSYNGLLHTSKRIDLPFRHVAWRNLKCIILRKYLILLFYVPSFMFLINFKSLKFLSDNIISKIRASLILLSDE